MAKLGRERGGSQSVSALTVQMAAYEALGKLGGTGTSIMMGDFSRAPQFLFPGAFGLGNTLAPYGPPRASAPGKPPPPST